MINESLEAYPNLNDWIGFTEDGVVDVRSGKVEIGQRITSAFRKIVSSELEVDVSRVNLLCGDTGLTPDEGYTAASCSMEISGSALRYVAAFTKMQLLTMAADRFACDVEDLSVNDGVISNQSKDSVITYWDLVSENGIEQPIEFDFDLKLHQESLLAEDENQLSYKRSLEIATGEFRYIHDFVLDNMLHARVVRPPAYHSRLVTVELDVVKSMRGVKQVIRDGSFLAVIGENEYQVLKASNRLASVAKWKPDGELSGTPIEHQLLQNPRRSISLETQTDPIELENRNLATHAIEKLEVRYKRPYLMHAAIGPSCAIALFDGNELTVWTHSQGVYPLRDALSFVLKLNDKNIRVIHLPGAGCYGHNGADDAALDAALLAYRYKGSPIRVAWSRKDEHCWEPYGSAMLVDIEAGLDEHNNLIYWNYDVYSDAHVKRPGPNTDGSQLLASWHLEESFPQPETTVPWNNIHLGLGFNAIPLYEIPNRNVNLHRVEPLPLRVSALRSLGAYTNVFAIESFMDELSERINQDPLELRLRYLSDDRAKELLEKVCNVADWYDNRRNENIGTGLGFAQYDNHRSYAVVVVNIEIDDDGTIHCREAFLGGDTGQIIDPAGVRCQLEGGFLQSLSWSLGEEVLYDKEGIQSQDWETYKLLAYNQIPIIETILVDRPGMPFLGCGEAMQGPTVAAIANAVSNVIGVRLRETPFTPDRVQSAAWESGN
jgi:nicotinate dehydrogenase subunit B